MVPTRPYTLFLALAAWLACGAALPAVLLQDDFSDQSALQRWELLPVANAWKMGLPPTAEWKVADHTLTVTGQKGQPWQVRVAGSADWQDYELSADLTILGPQQQLDETWWAGLCDPDPRWRCFYGEYDQGYEAALMVRYTGRWEYYRVQFSAAQNQVVLWKPKGSRLAVADCPLEIGKPQKVVVQLRGSHVIVVVGGRKLIDYWDYTAPPLRGKVGLGVYAAGVSFANLRVTDLPSGETKPPAHVPQFHLRGRWLYDGPEPIGDLSDTFHLRCSSFKVRPGDHLYFFDHLFFGIPSTAPAEEYGKLTECTSLEEGRIARLLLKTENPQGMQATTTLTAEYVSDTGNYKYTFDKELVFTKEIKCAKWQMDIADPYIYNAKMVWPGIGNPQPNEVRWGLFTRPDGTIGRYPLSQMMVPDTGTNYWPMLGEGGLQTWYPEPVVGACYRITAPKEQYNEFWTNVCSWGFDFHMWYKWPYESGFKPGEKYSGRVEVFGINAPELQKLWDRSTLEKGNQSELARQPLPVGEVGLTTFRRTVTMAEPNIEFAWKGTWDQTVGHGDHYSLRLDGPSSTSMVYGNSFCNDVFLADRYLISAWVKIKGAAKGVGPVLTVSPAYEEQPRQELATGWTGDADWRQISLVTDLPRKLTNWSLGLALDGLGTMWIDDLEIRPLSAAEQPQTTAGVDARPKDPLLLADLPLDEGAGGNVMDRSGYRIHGTIRDATWTTLPATEERFAGQPALDFAGGQNAVVLLPPAGTTRADQFSAELFFKPRPRTGAYVCTLLRNRFCYHLRLKGTGDQPATLETSSQIAFKRADGTMDNTFAKLEAPGVEMNKWHHAALTYDGQTYCLYLDGKPAGETKQAGAIKWDLGRFILLGAWYNPPLVGSPEQRGEGFEGYVRNVRLWGKALSAEEVAREAGEGK